MTPERLAEIRSAPYPFSVAFTVTELCDEVEKLQELLAVFVSQAKAANAHFGRYVELLPIFGVNSCLPASRSAEMKRQPCGCQVLKMCPLHAAAPDLLAACKVWIAHMDSLDVGVEYDPLTRARREYHAARMNLTRDAVASSGGIVDAP